MNAILTRNPKLCQILLRIKSGAGDAADAAGLMEFLAAESARRDTAAIEGGGESARGVAQGWREILSLFVQADEEHLRAHAGLPEAVE